MPHFSLFGSGCDIGFAVSQKTYNCPRHLCRVTENAQREARGAKRIPQNTRGHTPWSGRQTLLPRELDISPSRGISYGGMSPMFRGTRNDIIDRQKPQPIRRMDFIAKRFHHRVISSARISLEKPRLINLGFYKFYELFSCHHIINA